MTAADRDETAAVLEDVQFAYPGPHGSRRSVLGGVTLGVRRGELLALLGTNGSGKTTILRLLAGTLRPDAGEVRVFGRPTRSWSRLELARRVALLPQSLELPAGFTVGELVAMGRFAHASSWFAASATDAAAVERALADADALDLAGRRATELSGGERQRVAVAIALAQEPSLLLLDEPTLHLDLAHQLAVLETIAVLRRRRGIAVIAVLHDLGLAASWAPRVAVLAGGVVAADGAPDEVLTPALVSRLFGVAVDAVSVGGRRALALVVPAADAEASPPLPGRSSSRGRPAVPRGRPGR